MFAVARAAVALTEAEFAPDELCVGSHAPTQDPTIARRVPGRRPCHPASRCPGEDHQASDRANTTRSSMESVVAAPPLSFEFVHWSSGGFTAVLANEVLTGMQKA